MQRSITHPGRQRGAILIVSLLLLLVMTVLAITASQTTRLQERMAGNARDMDLAFQAGEAGLRAAEKALQDIADDNGRVYIRTCTMISEDCTVLDRPTDAMDYSHFDPEWWEKNASSYGDPEVQEFADLKSDPVMRTELWFQNGDTVSTGASKSQTGTAYYVITSRALGGTETAEVVVQSVFASPYVAQ